MTSHTRKYSLLRLKVAHVLARSRMCYEFFLHSMTDSNNFVNYGFILYLKIWVNGAVSSTQYSKWILYIFISYQDFINECELLWKSLLITTKGLKNLNTWHAPPCFGGKTRGGIFVWNSRKINNAYTHSD